MPITRIERTAAIASPALPLGSLLSSQEAAPMGMTDCEHPQHAQAGLCPGCGRWNYGEGYSTFAEGTPKLPSVAEIRKAFEMASQLAKESRYANALVALARCRQAIGLLNSMVCSGEAHTDASRHVVSAALHAIEEATGRA